ncbi:MAG: YlmC/YmxH family sporulation protein [Clostridia bacterium]|nr:YlmC/YmxH family sporulation protein [Clostridia bacterium]
MDCAFTDLRNKEVINLQNGRRLGYVSDVELDIRDARLVSILVSGEGGFFRKATVLRIPWACIQHVGEDLLLVSVKEDTVARE